MNILLCGCNGRMGKAVAAACCGEDKIVAGIDVTDANASFPVYKSIFEVREKAEDLAEKAKKEINEFDINDFKKKADDLKEEIEDAIEEAAEEAKKEVEEVKEEIKEEDGE